MAIFYIFNNDNNNFIIFYIIIIIIYKRIKPSNVVLDDFFETVTLEFSENFNKDQNLILILEYIGVINNEPHDKYEETVGFIKDSYITANNEKK